MSNPNTLKDTAFRAYEQYILNGKKLEEAQKNLVEGSVPYKYLKCIDLLTKKKANLSEEEQGYIEEFINATKSESTEKISLRYSFLKYDKESDPAQKEKVLSDIIQKHFPEFSDKGAAQPRHDHREEEEEDFEERKESPHHPAPASVTSQATEASALIDSLDLQKELQQLYSKQKSPYDFDPIALAQADFTKLTKEDFFASLIVISSQLVMVESEAFYKAFSKYLNEEFKKNKTYTIEGSILDNMSIEQMNKLIGYVPGLAENSRFAGSLFCKLFYKELDKEINSNLSLKEKRENLMKMYKYSQTLPEKLSGLKSTLLDMLLDNGIKMDLYDEDLFMEYVKSPLHRYFLKKKIVQEAYQWSNYVREIQLDEYKRKKGSSAFCKEMITAYLKHFFAHSKDVMERYNEFMDENLLTQVYEEVQLTTGQKVEVTHKNSTRLEHLSAEVNITLCQFNKETFACGEDISLWIEIKNVPTLFIKVFEINAENYYRKNMAPFKTDINLDGLIASIERTVEYKQEPQLRFREELKFPELKSQKGLYIIELIGNGKSSRAVIKIESLSFIAKPTIAGQLCYILDGKRNICNNETTSIWMDNQLFKANIEKGGRILVPFLPKSKTSKAILINDNLAQLVDFNREEEVYSMKCGFFLLPESVVTMNKAQILIRPNLTINNRIAELALLKNCCCVLYTSNYIDMIPATKTYDNLKIASNGELVISFQVPAQLNNLKISFSAEVTNISKATSQKLTDEHTFPIVNHSAGHTLGEAYLKYCESGYEVYLLGKNGEPLPKVLANIRLKTHLFNYNITKEATTDSFGKIVLGKLNHFSEIHFRVNIPEKLNIDQTWNIPKSSSMRYPQCIDIIEGEKIEIPIASESIDSAKLHLKLIDFQNRTIHNCSKAVVIEPGKNSLYGFITVNALQPGSYILWGFNENETVSIIVHQGQYWSQNPAYIQKLFSLVENRQHTGYIKIQNVTFEKTPEKKVRMNIKISGETKDQWRVHVVMCRYLPNSIDGLTQSLTSKDTFLSAEFPFQKWKNFYLSNRELSSEFRYCFDRRHSKRFMGNTLDRPKLVLKRAYVQDTDTQMEILEEGTHFEQAQEEQVSQPRQQYQAMSQTIDTSSKKGKQSSNIPTRGGLTNLISLFQNYISPEPIALYNLQANATGEVIVELDEGFSVTYGCVYALAIDRTSVAHYIHPLQGDKLFTRDLSLITPLDSKKAYSEMRTTECLEKNMKHKIEDSSSTDLQIVDSIEKVFMIIKELIRLNGTSIADLDKWEKILQWENYNEEEKNKMLSRMSCHELHFFIFKKDKVYLEKTLRPYLRNKMEKSFIDYYILLDSDSIIAYANSPALLLTLNPFELSLLVEILLRVGRKDMATTIAKRLRDVMINQRKPISQLNRIFDTVLSLNMLKTSKEGIEEAMHQPPPPQPFAPPASYTSIAAAPRAARFQPITSGELMKEEAPYQMQQQLLDQRSQMQKKLGGLDYDDYSIERSKQKQVLEEMGETKEYAETHYYNNPNGFDWRYLVQNSDFWADYAEYYVKDITATHPFLSSNFTTTCNNITEIIAVISMMDLPFKSQEHGYKTLQGRSVELMAANNLIIFKKEIKETKEEPRSNILVAQRYVDAELNDTDDTKIEEFLVNHVYLCEVILTNISSHNLDLDVLVQIPEGSLPLSVSPYQKSHSISINSYSTKKVSYHFYFPNAGQFRHFPANASINSIVVAKANECKLKVVKEKTKISEENFNDVIESGNHEMILNLMKAKPLEKIKGFKWDSLDALLKKDNKFFESFIALQKLQGRFTEHAWTYALYHKKNEQLISEYLNANIDFKSQFGFYFDSKLITVRPKDSSMKHLDYYPLVNPRAHKIAASGGQPMILNKQLYSTYKNFIFYLIEKPSMDINDKMNLCYYLLLQDRVKEALNIFTTGINQKAEIPAEGHLRLQYDYMSAYLDFYTGAPEFKLAKQIVAKYLNYPITSWRLLFLDIDQQLKEYAGLIDMGEEEEEEGKEAVGEEQRKGASNKKAIEKEPQLSVTMEDKIINIEYINLESIIMKIYVIDLEILFSRTPFLSQNAEDFSYVQANSSQEIKLDQKAKNLKLPLPEGCEAKNVVIEVSGSGLQKLITYFSTSLKIHIFENYGELKVTDDKGKQLPQVYIKVFAKNKDGQTKFYKDGYTDIRGRFDYVSLNASKLKQVDKFALFIMSDSHGSLIRECQPPPVTKEQEEDIGDAKQRVVKYYEKMKCKKKDK